MLDFLFAKGCTETPNPDLTYETSKANIKALMKQVEEIQKVLDAMAKVYVAERAKEIDSRDPDEKWYKTDQPIIDRAKRLELERQIMVAETELKALKQGWGR